MAVALNILGLSVAFAAFMVIMMQLDYDFGFDKFHKNADKIFRLECYAVEDDYKDNLLCRPEATLFLESSPHIVAGAITNHSEWMSPFFVEKDGERHYYEEISLIVEPSFFDVFTFDFVEGSKDVRISPTNIFIPLSLARKYFGNEPAVGKQIFHANWGNQNVVGVYRDIPDNSIFKNYVYFAIHESENKNEWGNSNYSAYLRVDDVSNIDKILKAVKLNFQSKGHKEVDYFMDKSHEDGFGYSIRAISDVHFATGIDYDETPKTSKSTLMILFIIAIVIIVIAGINFTNFSTALAPLRAKSINTQRVFGAPLFMMRFSIITEAVFISLLAYCVSILLLYWFKSAPFAAYVSADLSLSVHPYIIGGTALMALLAGMLAGLYPAFYMTSFAPMMAIKGSFGLLPKGRKLQNTLIGIQFVSSLALIVGASFIYLQNHFMQHAPLGYDKDELITVNVERIQRNRDELTNKLKAYSGVEDVTYSEALISGSDDYMGWGGRTYNGVNTHYQSLPVHYSFLKVMGIELTAGRDFRAEDASQPNGVYIFNETARKMFGFELNNRIEVSQENDPTGGEIIGFISDVKVASFRRSVEPMAFYVWGTKNWGDRLTQAYIRVKADADKRATMAYIHSVLAEFGPQYTFNVRFYDEVVQQLYERELALSALITLFSLIAIFISIVGVFGLVIFDSESRRKEIGIRKVVGASVGEIILLFNKAYFRILLICFVIATPLAWFAVSRWLENFAYTTPMHWWVYLMALVAVGVVTFATITFQCWRVANDDPIKAIKTE